MLVGFTGAQCTGKTTLLKLLKNQPMRDGVHVYSDKWSFVDEVTRKVMKQGHSINRDGDDITQLFILNEHLRNHTTGVDMVLDRCILDGYVYSSVLSRMGKVSEWVTSYACELLNLLVPKLDIIFYTSPEDVPLVDDGVRSLNRVFRQDVIDRYEELFAKDYYWMDKVIRLDGNIEHRMETILHKINENERIRQQQDYQAPRSNIRV